MARQPNTASDPAEDTFKRFSDADLGNLAAPLAAALRRPVISAFSGACPLDGVRLALIAPPQ